MQQELRGINQNSPLLCLTHRLSQTGCHLPAKHRQDICYEQLLVIHIQKTFTIQHSWSAINSNSKHCDQSLCFSSIALLKCHLFKIKISHFPKTLKPLKDSGTLAAKVSIICSNTNNFGIL